MSSAHRTDPYYDGVWDGVSAGNWTTAAAVRTRGLRLPGPLAVPQHDAEARLSAETSRLPRLRLLSAVDTWRTITAEQAAAIAGFPQIASGRGRMVGDLFATSILDIGVWPDLWTQRHPLAKSTTRLLRQSRTSEFDRIIKPQLTWAEWVAVTGGRGWTTGGQYDRHNVLAAEAALRIAEFTSAHAVIGEKHSHVRDLTGSAAVPDRRTADMTILRPDGLRIAVEFTASAHGTLTEKIHSWVDILATSPLRRTGLVLLFLVAPSPDFTGSERDTARAALFRAVSDAVGKTRRGVFGDTPVAERVFIADWTEWFPAARTASTEFIAGNAWCMTRPQHPEPEQRWTRRSLFGSRATRADGSYITYDDTAGNTARRDLPLIVAGVPWWLRVGRMPDGTTTVDLPDLSRHLQRSRPATPERKRPDEPSVLTGWGVGQGVTTPPRLRGIPAT